ncbi:histidine phosphatase family protein [Variovorax sp. PAMC28562]|uniref:histidine phosphatase family protein n=1 Tax=Variovorax sp. PAMC28562 TaxID=2762323 RepID=UPI00164D9135|nr:histidine phosphatase family protein [Variovorax sp. PAMC28562]QNK73177.1 histidine phosphatase family protein [Variovorax sp. PAMC28562]
MKLWMVRHAPVIAEAGLCYGVTDLAAHHDGTLAAAVAVSVAIGTRLLDGMAFVSSPLQRCAALAKEVAVLRTDLPLCRYDPNLAEMDFGVWEGSPWRDVARTEFDAWMADFADGRAGSTGESTRLFMQRVGIAWDTWLVSGTDALWVTHAGVMRAVTLLQRGVRVPVTAADWPAHPIAFGECVKIEV